MSVGIKDHDVKSRPRKAASGISEELIREVSHRIAQGKRVRRALPDGGRLHIDRSLPFLCVYRRPSTFRDDGTDHLVLGEAAYLIGSGRPKSKAGLSALVKGIAETVSVEYKSFLILEIWSVGGQSVSGPDQRVPKPSFRVLISPSRNPTAMVDALVKALKNMRILRQKPAVEVVFRKKQWPEDLAPMLSAADVARMNCFLVGLEVDPIYRDPETGEVYPIVLRGLHQRLSRAIKQSVFEFTYNQTSLRPVNYMALGRRAVIQALWKADRALAEISSSFDFLLQLTPVNIDQVWNEFRKNGFSRVPVFYYRPLPIDPAVQKARLFDIPIESIEDPTLASLFREKRTELDRQLSLLRDRGTREFLYGSMQLYGAVSNGLATLATEILSKIAPHSREGSGKTKLNAEDFAARAREEIEYYKQTYEGMSCAVQIREDTTGLMVSRGLLLVGRKLRVPESRVEALLQHEIGTHAVTYFNGRAQPFKQLYTGLAGYDELQEGLAVLAEYLVGGLSRPRIRLLAGRVVAAKALTSGATFLETFRMLREDYGFEQRTAYVITARIYRSGGLTKDAVYLRGLVGVLKYVEEGGELEPLLVGKIAALHIPVIRELQARQLLKPIPLRPRYLDRPGTREKILAIRNGMSVIDLI